MNIIQWEVEGSLYSSKMDALEASRGRLDILKVAGPYTDLATCYDWTKEPTESFDELIRERLLQIRDMYDYVSLQFSGGSDSNTVLRHAIKNNIHLDEIEIYIQSACNEVHHESNYEVTDYALPFLNSIKNLIPNTKISPYYLDYNYYIDMLSNDRWAYESGHLSLRHHPKNTHSTKQSNFCLISCDADPKVYYKDGRWYSSLYDSENFIFCSVIPNNIFFFTDPIFPKLHAKQLHMMKNYLTEHKLYDIETGSHQYKELVRDITREKTLIPRGVEVMKEFSSSRIMNDSKTKMMLRTTNDEIRKYYTGMMQQTINNKPLWRVWQGTHVSTLDLGP